MKIKFNKILSTLAIITPTIMMPSLAHAYCGVPPGVLPPVITLPTPADTVSQNVKEYPTTHYWKQCYSSVEIHSFNGGAKDSLEDLKIQYQQKYHAILLAQMNEASQNKIQAMNGINQVVIQTLNENYAALLEAKTKMKTQMLAKELDFQKDLKEKAFNEKNYGFFNDGNGEGGIVQTNTQSYEYFKNICKRNKMFNKTAGPVYKEKRNMAMNNAVVAKTKSIIANTSTGSANTLAKTVVNTHLNDYCSPDEIYYNQCVNPNLKLCVDKDPSSGVCNASDGTVFELVNKDMDAVNFLQPAGFNGSYLPDGTVVEEPKNEIKDELFKVKYTYDEGQEKAAEAFANNLIFKAGILSPSLGNEIEGGKENYVASYKAYLAQLNLAHYSFENAIKERKPITEGEIKMSERDLLRYIMHSFQDPDANAATMASKEKGKELMIYQLMTVNNKLKSLEYKQKERIAGLLGALTSQEANKPDLIKYLNSLK